MNARVANLLVFVCAAFVAMAAAAQTNTGVYMSDYEAQQTKISAGFVPYKSEVVLGEPIQVTFLVQNLGNANFEFWFGGDYRGTGRHDRFQIVVTNESGELLADPLSHPMDFGGLVQRVELARGKSFSNVVQLTDFRRIDKPGIYTVSCSFSFDERWRRIAQTNPVVNTSFRLRILERTPERVARVLDELLERARTAQGQQLGDVLGLMGGFGGDDAVSRLHQLVTNGPIELRVAAIETLAKIPSNATLKIALANLQNPEPKICSAAASALGAMGEEAGVEALLEAFPKSTAPVSGDILRALGASKSERAFPVLVQALDVRGAETQHAAIDALVNFGGSNAVAVLHEHINTNFLSLRYDLVLALVEKLHQPMQADWLLPVLVGREMNHEWLDSLRLLRMYGGEKAIPTMLSCLDFEVGWSGRNWWILETGVKPCPNAPACDYEHDPNTDGTPDQIQKNLRILQSLKPLEGVSGLNLEVGFGSSKLPFQSPR